MAKESVHFYLCLFPSVKDEVGQSDTSVKEYEKFGIVSRSFFFFNFLRFCCVAFYNFLIKLHMYRCRYSDQRSRNTFMLVRIFFPFPTKIDLTDKNTTRTRFKRPRKKAGNSRLPKEPNDLYIKI